MRILIILSIFLFISTSLKCQEDYQILNFEFEGHSINGILNQPHQQKPKGIVLIIHGYGRTNAVENNWHRDVRKAILKSGYSTYMWDKMGCGESEGTFDINQPVQNSADEAIAAIKLLQENNIPGAQDIGLWGVSRAGWINPLIIQKYEDIKFWISVSGVDDKENWGYLLYENLLIEGFPKEEALFIQKEWTQGNLISHKGGTFEEYLEATQYFRKNMFVKRWNNGYQITKEDYYASQPDYRNKKFDSQTGLEIVLDGFEEMLSKIEIPVLALFGEKDKNVDWRKTKRVYQEFLKGEDQLTIKSFPNTNHNMVLCSTGGFYEFQNNKSALKRPLGYTESITSWLLSLD